MKYVRLGAAGITVLWLAPSVMLINLSGDAQGGITLVVVAILSCAIYCGAHGLVRGMLESRSRWNGWSVAVGLVVLGLGVRGFSIVRACNLIAVASNPSTDARTLEALYEQRRTWYGEELSLRLAANRSTPKHVLREMFSREDDDLDYSLATNPSTPGDILHALSRRDEEFINSRLNWNPAFDRIRTDESSPARSDGSVPR